MKKSKIKFYNLDVYTETLDNGLNVVVIPYKNVNDAFVTLTTRYGGANYEFSVDGIEYKVPNGIAHFLEHKMFEQESGEDPFTFFNKSGTYSNAFTNYFNTSYLFAGSKNFKDNLNYLLDFVANPYFTDKNVEKEKGIIIEELKMYDDMPDNTIFERTIYNLFNTNPVKYPVGGYVSDVKKITKEDLYNCYNAFYNPKNMFLIITGNVDYKEAFEIVRLNQSTKKTTSHDVCIKSVDEKDTVYKKKEIVKGNVSMPYIAHAYKIPLKKFKDIDRKKLNLYLSLIFNILFDETSLFYEYTTENKLLETKIDIDTLDTDTHKAFILSFKSNNYNKIIKEIDNHLMNINISESDLSRKIKSNISSLLYIFDDISNTNKLMLNNLVLYNNLYTDVYDLLKSMNIKELNYIVKNLNLSNKSTLIIKGE